MLDTERHAKEKSGFGVTYLEVHSMFRLVESVSPELVATFDVGQSYPWDSEFHAYVNQHEHPLQGIDLTSISPTLHKAAVELDLPEWLGPSPVLLKQLAQIRLADLVLTHVGPNPKKVAKLMRRHGRTVTLMDHLPVTICSGGTRAAAEGIGQEFEAAGATVELHEWTAR